MQPGERFLAVSAPAVQRVQGKVRRPGGIVLLVEVDGTAVGENLGPFRIFDDNPGILPLYGGVIAQGGPVHHDRELVAAAAFLGARLQVQVMVAVVDERDFDVVRIELDGVALPAIDLVLDVASALHFPTVVDAAAGDKPERQCHGGRNAVRVHGPASSLSRRCLPAGWPALRAGPRECTAGASRFLRRR